MHVVRSALLPGSPGEVLEHMSSKELQRAKADALGARDHTFASTEADGVRTVRTTRTMATAGVAEFVRALVTPTIIVTETEVWDLSSDLGRGIDGTFTLDVQGAPVGFRGEVDITVEPGGSRLTFSGDWVATAPLFKSVIESASVSSVTETMDAEFAELRALLTRCAPELRTTATQ